MTHTTRKHDNEIESIVSGFLDKHFYPRISERKNVEVRRWRDREHQLDGIDVSIGNLNFDEKCKCYGCMNSILQYPSFEISLDLRYGDRLEGWFVNPRLKTDYYAFLGIFATVDNPKELVSESQLEKVDVLWVKKRDVLDFIFQNEGIGGDNLIEMSRTLVAESNADISTGAYGQKFRRKFGCGKFWLTYSPRLFEKPVNLVIPRETLEGFPNSKHFVVAGNSLKTT